MTTIQKWIIVISGLLAIGVIVFYTLPELGKCRESVNPSKPGTFCFKTKAASEASKNIYFENIEALQRGETDFQIADFETHKPETIYVKTILFLAIIGVGGGIGMFLSKNPPDNKTKAA